VAHAFVVIALALIVSQGQDVLAAGHPPSTQATAEKDPCPNGIPHVATAEFAGVTLQSECVFVSGSTVTLTFQARNNGIDRTFAPQLASGTSGAPVIDILDDTGRASRVKRVELGGRAAKQTDLIKWETTQVQLVFDGFLTEGGRVKAARLQSLTIKFLLWEASDAAKRRGSRNRYGAQRGEFRFTDIALTR
jgi:hypothetical protein